MDRTSGKKGGEEGVRRKEERGIKEVVGMEEELRRCAVDGMCELMDKFMEVSPGFAAVKEVSDLPDVDILIRDHQRPAGYSAT